MHADQGHRSILQKIARRAMLERDMRPDFSPQALAELGRIKGPATDQSGLRDLRNLLWCSIDNDDSRDLDQLTAVEQRSEGNVTVLVAVADVDSLVKKDSAIDEHASQNTTSVYTEAKIFPMLPEKLSTDFTSLNFASDRAAMVVEIIIAKDGSIERSEVYGAMVRNQAKLAYNSVAAWLDATGPMPAELVAVAGLAEKLKLQDRVAQQLKVLRHSYGALTLQTIEAHTVFEDGSLKDLEAETKNRAKEIIEDFMIAANGVTARYLESKKMPALRRVVRTPKRWDRIRELAADNGFTLPEKPEAKALEHFLQQAKEADPLRFPDLSLSVIKLLGKGEYVAEFPGAKPDGHFGLAVKDYGHSTAPNRRYPDIITQRLLKAAVNGQPCPYTDDELAALAQHCTRKEDDAKKVERRVKKSAAALLLENRIGEQFDAIVTGAADKGTWVRLFHPPIEGRLSQGFEGQDVGQRLRVELISTDVERGFIDFRRVK